MNDQMFRIALSIIPQIGPAIVRELIAHVGSIEEIFTRKKQALQKIPGIGNQRSASICDGGILEKAEKELAFVRKHKIRTSFFLDKDYPDRLRECPDAPVMLYIKGDVDLNSKKIISIVGTRNSTSYGNGFTKKLIEELKEAGHEVLIVSGLAYGIDIQAHKAALKNGYPTVAVLGHGLDMIYPADHRPVAKEITGQGALVTEFSTHAARDRSNFVRRNRIIAGLADATIVVESGVKGGALITADIANSYNRDVFACPGEIGKQFSAGCNKLIKTNRAALIESAKDLEYILGWEKQDEGKTARQQILFTELEGDEKIIYDIIRDDDKISIDLIARKAGFNLSHLSAVLLNLEFMGVIRCLPGKIYSTN